MHGREEQRRRHQHRCHVRHHRAVLAPVLNHNKRGIDRQQPAPEEQGAFLTAPNRTQFEIDRQIAVRMGCDVLDREIADHEQVAQTNKCRRNTGCSTKCCITGAGDQFIVSEADAEYRRDDGVRRHDPGKRQGELAKLCCHVSYSFLEICTPAAASFSYLEAHFASIVSATNTPSRPSFPVAIAVARSIKVSGRGSLPTYLICNVCGASPMT